MKMFFSNHFCLLVLVLFYENNLALEKFVQWKQLLIHWEMHYSKAMETTHLIYSLFLLILVLAVFNSFLISSMQDICFTEIQGKKH